MQGKYIEVKVYTGDIYEGTLLQADPDKMLIREPYTGNKIRIYKSAIISVRSLGWQEIAVGVA